MTRHIVIHTGDAEIGKITSDGPVANAPTIGNIYQIGPKRFEVVSFSTEADTYQVICKPFIEAEGTIQ